MSLIVDRPVISYVVAHPSPVGRVPVIFSAPADHPAFLELVAWHLDQLAQANAANDADPTATHSMGDLAAVDTGTRVG